MVAVDGAHHGVDDYEPVAMMAAEAAGLMFPVPFLFSVFVIFVLVLESRAISPFTAMQLIRIAFHEIS